MVNKIRSELAREIQQNKAISLGDLINGRSNILNSIEYRLGLLNDSLKIVDNKITEMLKNMSIDQLDEKLLTESRIIRRMCYRLWIEKNNLIENGQILILKAKATLSNQSFLDFLFAIIDAAKNDKKVDVNHIVELMLNDVDLLVNITARINSDDESKEQSIKAALEHQNGQVYKLLFEVLFKRFQEDLKNKKIDEEENLLKALLALINKFDSSTLQSISVIQQENINNRAGIIKFIITSLLASMDQASDKNNEKIISNLLIIYDHLARSKNISTEYVNIQNEIKDKMKQFSYRELRSLERNVENEDELALNQKINILDLCEQEKIIKQFVTRNMIPLDDDSNVKAVVSKFNNVVVGKSDVSDNVFAEMVSQINDVEYQDTNPKKSVDAIIEDIKQSSLGTSADDVFRVAFPARLQSGFKENKKIEALLKDGGVVNQLLKEKNLNNWDGVSAELDKLSKSDAAFEKLINNENANNNKQKKIITNDINKIVENLVKSIDAPKTDIEVKNFAISSRTVISGIYEFVARFKQKEKKHAVCLDDSQKPITINLASDLKIDLRKENSDPYIKWYITQYLKIDINDNTVLNNFPVGEYEKLSPHKHMDQLFFYAEKTSHGSFNDFLEKLTAIISDTKSFQEVQQQRRPTQINNFISVGLLNKMPTLIWKALKEKDPNTAIKSLVKLYGVCVHVGDKEKNKQFLEHFIKLFVKTAVDMHYSGWLGRNIATSLGGYGFTTEYQKQLQDSLRFFTNALKGCELIQTDVKTDIELEKEELKSNIENIKQKVDELNAATYKEKEIFDQNESCFDQNKKHLIKKIATDLNFQQKCKNILEKGKNEASTASQKITNFLQIANENLMNDFLASGGKDIEKNVNAMLAIDKIFAQSDLLKMFASRHQELAAFDDDRFDKFLKVLDKAGLKSYGDELFAANFTQRAQIKNHNGKFIANIANIINDFKKITSERSEKAKGSFLEILKNNPDLKNYFVNQCYANPNLLPSIKQSSSEIFNSLVDGNGIIAKLVNKFADYDSNNKSELLGKLKTIICTDKNDKELMKKLFKEFLTKDKSFYISSLQKNNIERENFIDEFKEVREQLGEVWDNNVACVWFNQSCKTLSGLIGNSLEDSFQIINSENNNIIKYLDELDKNYKLINHQSDTNVVFEMEKIFNSKDLCSFLFKLDGKNVNKFFNHNFCKYDATKRLAKQCAENLVGTFIESIKWELADGVTDEKQVSNEISRIFYYVRGWLEVFKSQGIDLTTLKVNKRTGSFEEVETVIAGDFLKEKMLQIFSEKCKSKMEALIDEAKRLDEIKVNDKTNNAFYNEKGAILVGINEHLRNIVGTNNKINFYRNMLLDVTDNLKNMGLVDEQNQSHLIDSKDLKVQQIAQDLREIKDANQQQKITKVNEFIDHIKGCKLAISDIPSSMITDIQIALLKSIMQQPDDFDSMNIWLAQFKDVELIKSIINNSEKLNCLWFLSDDIQLNAQLWVRGGEYSSPSKFNALLMSGSDLKKILPIGYTSRAQKYLKTKIEKMITGDAGDVRNFINNTDNDWFIGKGYRIKLFKEVLLHGYLKNTAEQQKLAKWLVDGDNLKALADLLNETDDKVIELIKLANPSLANAINKEKECRKILEEKVTQSNDGTALSSLITFNDLLDQIKDFKPIGKEITTFDELVLQYKASAPINVQKYYSGILISLKNIYLNIKNANNSEACSACAREINNFYLNNHHNLLDKDKSYCNNFLADLISDLVNKTSVCLLEQGISLQKSAEIIKKNIKDNECIREIKSFLNNKSKKDIDYNLLNNKLLDFKNLPVWTNVIQKMIDNAGKITCENQTKLNNGTQIIVDISEADKELTACQLEITQKKKTESWFTKSKELKELEQKQIGLIKKLTTIKRRSLSKDQLKVLMEEKDTLLNLRIGNNIKINSNNLNVLTKVFFEVVKCCQEEKISDELTPAIAKTNQQFIKICEACSANKDALKLCEDKYQSTIESLIAQFSGKEFNTYWENSRFFELSELVRNHYAKYFPDFDPEEKAAKIFSLVKNDQKVDDLKPEDYKRVEKYLKQKLAAGFALHVYRYLEDRKKNYIKYMFGEKFSLFRKKDDYNGLQNKSNEFTKIKEKLLNNKTFTRDFCASALDVNFGTAKGKPELFIENFLYWKLNGRAGGSYDANIQYKLQYLNETRSSRCDGKHIGFLKKNGETITLPELVAEIKKEFLLILKEYTAYFNSVGVGVPTIKNGKTSYTSYKGELSTNNSKVIELAQYLKSAEMKKETKNELPESSQEQDLDYFVSKEMRVCR